MKKIIIPLVFVISVFVFGTALAAASLGGVEGSQQINSQELNTSQNYQMAIMMNPQNFQLMQAFMQQLQKGNLASKDQQQMWQIMQARAEGAVTESPRLMMGYAQAVPANTAALQGGNNMMFFNGNNLLFWTQIMSIITTVLLWAVLLLGITALWKFLNKKYK